MNLAWYIALMNVDHDGHRYEKDEKLELTKNQAAALLAADAIRLADTEETVDGFANGESTASADALAEQTDKNTNQDPLNNKDGGDATQTASSSADGEPLTPGASVPGAEELLTPASADAVQDPVDPAPAVDSTAGGEGQTILDPAATPLDGAATGEVASPVVAEAPAQADQAPADPASADQVEETTKKTRRTKAAE